MATFYIDFDNGNDASAGTSWATAWKTITSGATAARIAPGDEIRIAKSPDPISIGNATWTNGSVTVTLATAQTATIDNCETAWTAANSATASRITTSPVKQGTYVAQIVTPAATATSTKYAYFAVGGASGLDLSAYQQITLWFNNSNSAVADANRYVIKLCSDTTGDTAVDEFAIPAIASTGTWVPLVITKNGGGNLGNAIKSIAWYTGTSSPGNSQAVRLDNISASKTDNINLTTLISKSSTSWNQTEPWHPLQFIDGTTVSLGMANSISVSTTRRGYYTSGTSPETVTTYIQKTTKLTPLATSTTTGQQILDSGTSGNLISFIGGWDTATTTRNGVTFMDGQNGFGYGLQIYGYNFINLQYLNFVRYNYGLEESNTGSNSSIYEYIGGVANEAQACRLRGNASILRNSIFNHNATGSASNIVTLQVNTSLDKWVLDNVYFVGNFGISLTAASNSLNSTYDNLYFYNCGTAFAVSSSKAKAIMTNVTIDRNGSGVYQIWLGSSNNVEIYNLTLTNTTASNGIFALSDSVNNMISNATIDTTSTLWYSTTNAVYSNVIFRNSNYTGSSIMPATATATSQGPMVVSIDNATASKYSASVYGYNYALYAFQQTTTVHTAGSKAWQINVLNTNINSSYPYDFPIAKVAVNANSLVTFKAWVKKSHATDIGAGLIIKKQQVAGITSDVTATKTNDTNWEELTLTFTPTETGVVEIDLQAYWLANLADESIYVDDITVTQA